MRQWKSTLCADKNEHIQTVLQNYDVKNTLERAENKTIETYI